MATYGTDRWLHSTELGLQACSFIKKSLRASAVRKLFVKYKAYIVSKIGNIDMTDIDVMAKKAQSMAAPCFERIDDVALYNTEKVLNAFHKYKVQDACFGMSTGYGYDDLGRDALENIYAEVFKAEKALVRQTFVNGTHTIGCAMFSCVKTGDILVSATGAVYDTLQTVTGEKGAIGGTFLDYGIGYNAVSMKNGEPDMENVLKAVENTRVKAVFIQRSRGYGDRITLSCERIGEMCSAIKAVNPGVNIIVDNCYGEFCQKTEPLEFGADLICGSLIKNPGGGMALTGGYIAGKAELVEKASYRMTVPGIGGECGATLGQNRNMLQGFFMAPHITAQALKTAVFASAILSQLGYELSPKYDDIRYDIIQTIRFGNEKPLVDFCKGIQKGSPVDSFATPEPWDMPGYDCPVIMAAGAFVSGASIELSCDAPMRSPYIAYMQGGLTYESGKLGIIRAVQEMLKA